MPKRTICIQNAASLSIKNDALAICQRGELRGLVPLEDIWVLIIETHQAQITTAALSKLVDSGIGVMLCGDDHMPNGLLLPLGAHSRHAAIVDDQLAISKPLQKRLWQRIVQAKISNQAEVMDLLGLDGTAVRAMAKDVLSGDASNRESVAASAYLKRSFRRAAAEMVPSPLPSTMGTRCSELALAERQSVAGGLYRAASITAITSMRSIWLMTLSSRFGRWLTFSSSKAVWEER